MKNRYSKILIIISAVIVLAITLSALGCSSKQSSDHKQQVQQEKILLDIEAQAGLPAIKNGFEKKLLKQILEMRDQSTLTTYVYTQSQMTGKLVYLGEAIGFGIPSTTQYTNPDKIIRDNGTTYGTLPQADPNGLFSGESHGTWILMKDPSSSKVSPVLFEPDVVISTFKFNL